MSPSLATKEQFATAFKGLPPSDQQEAYQLITDYIQSGDLADEMYQLSTESLADIWDNEENEHWDNFLKQNSQTSQLSTESKLIALLYVIPERAWRGPESPQSNN